MTLPVEYNAITMNDVNVELGLSGTATITLDDAAVRTLFAVASGAISLHDGHGKSAVTWYYDLSSPYYFWHQFYDDEASLWYLDVWYNDSNVVVMWDGGDGTETSIEASGYTYYKGAEQTADYFKVRRVAL